MYGETPLLISWHFATEAAGFRVSTKRGYRNTPRTAQGTEKRAFYEDSYNVIFRKPRFFFDNFGTREFFVYNKQDEHIMLSHTSWILIFTPEEMHRTQGWYAVHDASSPHWKYFWFD